MSVIIPANNEETHIAPCLDALLHADWPAGNPDAGVEVIVVANGCTDQTVKRAERRADQFAKRDWKLIVLDLPAIGKLGALNAGDSAASGDVRVYLDADVTISRPLLLQLYTALSGESAAYASGQVMIPVPQTWASRAYRKIYRCLPFLTHGVPGCGLFAMNKAGRALWDDWPDIISDDTFARLQFRPNQRIGVSAHYHWPLVEGFGTLVKVRRRQNAGVAELRRKFPHLFTNDDKVVLSRLDIAKLILTSPIGFAVYVSVSIIVKFYPSTGNNSWTRGR